MDTNEHEGVPDFRCESFDQDGPSYIQAYIVSAFFLIGFFGFFINNPAINLPGAFMLLIWFGTLMYWLVQNRHAEKTFASDRITVMNGRVTHSFRYTVTEASFVEANVDDIEEIRVHYGERVAIELIDRKDGDFFFLRDEEHARQFCETLQRLNPEIRVTDE